MSLCGFGRGMTRFEFKFKLNSARLDDAKRWLGAPCAGGRDP